MKHRQTLARFYVDNRDPKNPRWVTTIASKVPSGYAQVIKWWKGSREFEIYVWGKPLEVSDAQKAVLSYWALVEGLDAPLFD